VKDSEGRLDVYKPKVKHLVSKKTDLACNEINMLANEIHSDRIGFSMEASEMHPESSEIGLVANVMSLNT